MLQLLITNVLAITKDTTTFLQNVYLSHNKFYQYTPKSTVNTNNHNNYQFVYIIKHTQTYHYDTHTI